MEALPGDWPRGRIFRHGTRRALARVATGTAKYGVKANMPKRAGTSAHKSRWGRDSTKCPKMALFRGVDSTNRPKMASFRGFVRYPLCTEEAAPRSAYRPPESPGATRPAKIPDQHGVAYDGRHTETGGLLPAAAWQVPAPDASRREARLQRGISFDRPRNLW